MPGKARQLIFSACFVLHLSFSPYFPPCKNRNCLISFRILQVKGHKMSDDESYSDSTPRSSASDSGSDVDERSRQEVKKKSLKKKVVIKDIPLDEAWAEFARVEKEMKAKKTKMVRLSSEAVQAVEKEGQTNGFDEDDIKRIWKMITIPGNQAAVMHQKEKLIFAMIPNTRIGAHFVTDVCWWLVSSSHHNPTQRGHLYLMLLKYLFGLVEYSLIDGDPFTKTIYTALFTLHVHKDLVSWLFSLLKKITTRDNFQRFQVTLTLEKWKTCYGPGKSVLHSMLKKYKILRPEFLTENVFAAASSATRFTTKLKDNFKKSLYHAKKRGINGAVPGINTSQGENPSQAEDDSDMSKDITEDIYEPLAVLHRQFFKDLVPTFDSYSWIDIFRGKAKGPPVLFWALLERGRLLLFQTDEEALEMLESYLSIVFEHKFSHYKPEDEERYTFTLERCCEISLILNRGLFAVDDWLFAYLVTWDGDQWSDQIYRLISFLNPFEFNLAYQKVFKKLELHLVASSMEEGGKLWISLKTLFFRWLEKLSSLQRFVSQPENRERGQYEDDLVFTTNAVNNLFAVVLRFIRKYIALNSADHNCEPIVLRFIEFFTHVAKLVSEKKTTFYAVPPLCLIHCVILMDKITLFDAIAECLNTSAEWERLDPAIKNDLERLRNEFSRFFGEGLIHQGLPFSELFAKELERPEQTTQRYQLEKKLSSWKLENSLAMETFKTPRVDQLNFQRMRELAPALHKFYFTFRRDDFVPMHASTPAAHIRRLRQL